MAITDRQVIINYHTTGQTGTPAFSAFEVGEIVVQNTASDPALYIHSGTTAVAKILSEDKVKALIDAAGVQSINDVKGKITLTSSDTKGDVSLDITNSKISATLVGLDTITGETKDAAVNEVKGTATDYTNLGLVEAKLKSLDAEQTTQNANIETNTAAIEALKGLAVTSVTEGSTNGTVKVNGTDVAVHGLGTAAYQNVNAFDASGAAATAKSEVIGGATTDGDTLKKLEDKIIALGDNPLTGISAADSSVTVSAKANKAQTVKVNISEDADNALTLATDGLKVDKDLFDASGAAATAKSEVIGDMTGDTKTLGALQDAIEALGDNPLTGITAGNNGIEVSTKSNKAQSVSAKVVEANGLSITANGIAMAVATDSTAGAMSAADHAQFTADHTKLEGIEAGAEVNVLKGVQVNGANLTPDADKKVNVTVAEGSTNGAIAVNGAAVPVHGLGTAAYEDTTAFDEAGAAASAKTIIDAYTVNGKAISTSPVLSIKDMSDVDSAMIPTDKYVLTYDSASTQWIAAENPKAPEYTITKDAEAGSGMASTYHLTKNGVNVGEAINIPKDQFLKSATFIATSSEVPSGKEAPGDDFPYILFEWQNDGATSISDTWIPCGSLVDVYTEGNGIDITDNEISAVVDTTNANGLSVGANGIGLALATSGATGTNGAMSSLQATKLEGIEDGAEVNTIEGVQLNGADIALDANKKANVVLPSATVSGESAGVNVQVVETTGEIKTVTVTVTPGSVADNDTNLVNGDAVYDAIEAAKTAIKGGATESGNTLGKLEDRIEALGDDALTGITAGNGIEVSTKSGKAQSVSAKVNTAASAGVALSNDATNGITVAVTPGSVENNNGSVVTGGAVYTAIDNAKTELKGSASSTSASTTIEGAKRYADAVAATAVDGLDATATTSTVSGVTVQVTETNGKLDSAATLTITGGAVAENNAALVNGGQVYTAIDGAKSDVIGQSGDDASANTIYGAKAYADEAVAGKNVSATGDNYVSATAANNQVTVAATQKTQSVIDNALVGIETDKESGAAVSANHKLDFSLFRIDAGTY